MALFTEREREAILGTVAGRVRPRHDTTAGRKAWASIEARLRTVLRSCDPDFVPLANLDLSDRIVRRLAQRGFLFVHDVPDILPMTCFEYGFESVHTFQKVIDGLENAGLLGAFPKLTRAQALLREPLRADPPLETHRIG